MHKERVLRIVQHPQDPNDSAGTADGSADGSGDEPGASAPTSTLESSALTDQELQTIAARAWWCGPPGRGDQARSMDEGVLRAIADEAARRAHAESAEARSLLRREVEALSERLSTMRHTLTEACEEAARAFTRAHDALEADTALATRGAPSTESPSDEQLGRLVYEAIVSASKLHTAQRKVFCPWSEANDTVRAANISAARAVRLRLESTLKKY